MSCRRVRGWLHRDVETLDDTQRLILDDHLAACERCRGDRYRMQLMRRVGAALPVPPAGSREYSRAIARALLEDSAATGAPRPARRWRVPLAIATLAAAVIALGVVVAGVRRDAPSVAGPEAAAPSPAGVAAAPTPSGSRPPAPPSEATPFASPTPTPSSAAPIDVVEDGALASRSRAIPRGAEVPPNAPLRATERARVRLASMQVVIAASTELRWVPAERMVLLERGRLEVETVATGGARVVTERFEVELDDAALTVDPSAVRVRRGAARIVDRSRRLIAHVTSGGSWRLSDAVRAVRPPELAPAAGPPAIERLAAARAQLAAQDLAGAEQTALGVLATAPSRADEAEARILLAEVAHAQGALDLAVTRYLAVANTLSDLPAAESALYAAARIELRRTRAAAVRALLTRYLDRYPRGRYADDARRELTSLP